MKKTLALSKLVLLGAVLPAVAEVEFSVGSSVSWLNSTFGISFTEGEQSFGVQAPVKTKATITPPAIGFGYVFPLTKDIKIIPFLESSTLSYNLSFLSAADQPNLVAQLAEYEGEDEEIPEGAGFGLKQANILSLGARMEAKLSPWISGYGEAAFRPRSIVLALETGGMKEDMPFPIRLPVASESGWYAGAGVRFQWNNRFSTLHGVYYEYDKLYFSGSGEEEGTTVAVRLGKTIKGWLFRNALVFTFH